MMKYARVHLEPPPASAESRAEHSREFVDSYLERRLRTRHSSKKSDSLFTRRALDYDGIKDSLLLYDDEHSDSRETRAVKVPRRHMSGAKDCFEREPVDSGYGVNFDRGKQPWYHNNSEDSGSIAADNFERPTTINSVRIKQVIENATHSIKNTQQACQGIRQRLDKYQFKDQASMPGTYAVEDEGQEGTEHSPKTGFSGMVPEKTAQKVSEPIEYLPKAVLVPLLVKSVFFMLAQCATSEDVDYSFTKTCQLLVSSESSSLTLSQLDALVLQLAEVWLATHSIPALTKAPWRFYQVAAQYWNSCLIGQDVPDLRHNGEFHELVELCERHEKLSRRLYRASLIALLASPIALTFGLLLVHKITFSWVTSNPTEIPHQPVYSSLMAVVFSPAQFVILIWCLWSQFSQDAFQHLERYVLGKNESFIQETEFLADQLDQTRPSDATGMDAGTKQSPLCNCPLGAATKLEAIEKPFNAHPEGTHVSLARLAPFALAAYESPLQHKEIAEPSFSAIRPISPNVVVSHTGPPKVVPSRGKFQWALRLPLYVVSLYLRVLQFVFKIALYATLLSVSLIIGPRNRRELFSTDKAT
ncbi:LAQU0S04e10000g1_1 [Lachancea quebecensis]|uniref:LAQU0S04e10000g1_1 n=1 Tax=Lachancea quebecensis TaxID=1654605 RepID=A0A0P1KRR7_9SACH|nr:LAQU0S04e10000g1_1 [Lachancea quebecensis]